MVTGSSAQTQGVLWGFEENNGQWVNDSGQVDTVALYRLRAPGLCLTVYANWLHYQVIQHKKDTTAPTLSAIDSLMFPFLADTAIYQEWTPIQMWLQGSNPNPTIVASDTLDCILHYFTGTNADQCTAARSYDRLRIQNVYPGVDWIMRIDRTDGLKVEFDFEVHPGADPEQIRLRYRGMDSLYVCPQHMLHVTCPIGQLLESPPFVFQIYPNAQGQNTTTVIPCQYNVDTDSSEITFALGQPYNPAYPLIIDPQMSWSTYFGLMGSDEISQAVWHNDRLYVCGTVNAPLNTPPSGQFPFTGSPATNPGVVLAPPTNPPSSDPQSFDFFVACFDADNQLLHYVVIGGTHDEKFLPRMTINADGYVFLHGTSRSVDYPILPTTPVSNVWQTTAHSEIAEQDVVLTILDRDLSTIIYSTTFGGRQVLTNPNYASIAKENYLQVHMGRPASDYALSIASFDYSGDTYVYVCGGTNSDINEGFPYVCNNSTGINCVAAPIVVGPVQTGTTSFNGYVGLFRFRVVSTSPFAFEFEQMWMTSFGGNNQDFIMDVATIPAQSEPLKHRAIFCGALTSHTFPLVDPIAGPAAYLSALQNPNTNGTEDVFVFEYSPDGELLWSSSFGSAPFDRPAALVGGPNGEIYFAGIHRSLPNTFLQTGANNLNGIAGEYDAYVSCINNTRNGVCWTRFIGGALRDDNYHRPVLALDGAGNIWTTGFTENANQFDAIVSNPLVSDFWQQNNTFNGTRDAFAVRLSPAGNIDFGTFYGGSGDEYGASVCVSPVGDVYVVGLTTSSCAPPTVAIPTIRQLNSPNGFFNNSFSGGTGWFNNQAPFSGLTDGFLFRISIEEEGQVRVPCVPEIIPPPYDPNDCLPDCD